MGEGAVTFRNAMIALVVACLALLAAAAPAAATWEGRQLTGEAAEVSVFGIDCPTNSLCVAVGGNNTVASSTNPTGGQPSWQTVYAGQGAVETPGTVFPGRQVRGVSCPSAQLCVAVTYEGNAYIATEPTGSAAAWAVTDLDGEGPNTHFFGVFCPSALLCVAVADNGRIATSTNPTGGSAAWSTVQLGESLDFRAVSCASPAFCVAVGDYGQIVSSSNPAAGAWTQVPAPVSNSHLFGVSCVLPSLCVSGNGGGNLLSSTNPLDLVPGWRAVPGGGSVQITSASCVTASACVAVDNNGDVLTSTNPTGGPEAWTFENVLPYPGTDPSGEAPANHFFGVSSPSTRLCAIAANRGQIFTSTDPFARPPEPVEKNQRKRYRPKRPRVKLAKVPPPGIPSKRPRATARYRFFAKGHAQVRGFLCKLDGQRPKRCRSPKSYRVGRGKHRFSVRAIGWTGLKGPAEVHRFEVCAPTEYGWCQGPPVAGGQ